MRLEIKSIKNFFSMGKELDLVSVFFLFLHL